MQLGISIFVQRGYTDFGVCYPEIRSPLVSLESGVIVPGYLYILQDCSS